MEEFAIASSSALESWHCSLFLLHTRPLFPLSFHTFFVISSYCKYYPQTTFLLAKTTTTKRHLHIVILSEISILHPVFNEHLLLSLHQWLLLPINVPYSHPLKPQGSPMITHITIFNTLVFWSQLLSYSIN